MSNNPPKHLSTPAQPTTTVENQRRKKRASRAPTHPSLNQPLPLNHPTRRSQRSSKGAKFDSNRTGKRPIIIIIRRSRTAAQITHPAKTKKAVAHLLSNKWPPSLLQVNKEEPLRGSTIIRTRQRKSKELLPLTVVVVAGRTNNIKLPMVEQIAILLLIASPPPPNKNLVYLIAPIIKSIPR